MEKHHHERSTFSGKLGFVLSAAGASVGLGNIWRFPYLAAKYGGGIFLLIYIILALTFGYSMIVAETALGRMTRKSPVGAFGKFGKSKWLSFGGWINAIIPVLIVPYYSVIGGWIGKYMFTFITMRGNEAARDGYFTSFITSGAAPVVFMLIFLSITAFIVYGGVEKGIERFARIVMPGLLLMIIGISIFSLTLRFEDGNGVVRTGLQGLSVYVLPNFDGITWKRFLEILLDAMSQLFFSLSVSMGIMITYGSYVKKDVNLGRSLGQIEFFDTFVAFLAGLMIIPAVYVFFGTEGMASGPSLMFISLPKVFAEMGSIGSLIGAVFFVMVLFAALTSSVSIMETLVANCMDIFHTTRKKTSLVIGLLSAAASVVICMGYNVLYFELTLPNGQTAQLLDVMDYISNSFLMPFISLLTCIFIGWVIKPKWICDEMESSGHPFGRKKLYIVMIRYVVPVMMAVLFLQSAGVFTMIQSLFK